MTNERPHPEPQERESRLKAFVRCAFMAYVCLGISALCLANADLILSGEGILGLVFVALTAVMLASPWFTRVRFGSLSQNAPIAESISLLGLVPVLWCVIGPSISMAVSRHLTKSDLGPEHSPRCEIGPSALVGFGVSMLAAGWIGVKALRSRSRAVASNPTQSLDAPGTSGRPLMTPVLLGAVLGALILLGMALLRVLQSKGSFVR